jgi:tetratricopeptide (TPR) repeat protein
MSLPPKSWTPIMLHSARKIAIASISAASIALCVSACGGAQARRAKHMEKGQTYLAAKNFEKARVEFQNALQIAPLDAEARFEMGVVDEKLNKPREAAQFYQGTIDVKPDHVGARTNLARLYVFSGVPDRALDLIAPALQKNPGNAELLTVRAAARLQQKDVNGAQEDAQRAVQLEPANEDAIAVLAGLYNSTGAVDKAQALLETAVQRIPNTVDLRLALVQIYSLENRTADGEALLLKLIELQPAEKAHRLRLAQYYARLNQIDAAENALRQAVKALPAERQLKLSLVDFLAERRGRDAAEKELQGLIAAEPADVELKFALAKFYESGRQWSKSEDIYQAVIAAEKLDPQGLGARNRLAALRAQRNDVAGALVLVNEVLAKSPRDDDALALRGNLSLAKQDPRAAIADLRAVLRDQPNAIGVLRALARAHLANGEPAVAEETMRHAVESNPKDAGLQLDLAQLLGEMGKPGQAKPILAELVKQHPENVDALDTQFRVAMTAKDYATARPAAEAISALRPKSALGPLYQGMVAEADKRGEDALRLYSAAVELQPEAPEALQAEVRLLLNEKRVADAIKRVEDFSARYPKNPLGPDVKGELLLGTGRTAEAQAAFNLAIARSPKWWIPYRGLAYAQVAAENPDAAIATLRAAQPIVEQPEALGAELAAVLERQGKVDQAIAEYEGLLQRFPQSEAAANNLAMMLVTYKTDPASLDRAKKLSAQFAESANPSYLDTYGWVLYRRGETAASVPVLERVVAKVPNEPLARFHLGMAQSRSGSSVEARDNLARAVNSGAKFSGLEEAKATLDKLAKLPATAAADPKS